MLDGLMRFALLGLDEQIKRSPKVEKSKVTEVLPQVTSALLKLETAKSDCKLRLSSIFETYEFTANEEKAVMRVAKAQIAEKLEALEPEIDTLAEVIGIAQEIVTA